MNETVELEKIIEIFADISEMDRIALDSRLIDDLELSSLESFAALGELEEAFHIKIPESKVIQMVTIHDVYDIVTDLVKGRT